MATTEINRVNCYTCQICGGRIATIDRDMGVTPMYLGCKMTEGCVGMMISAFYRVAGMTDLPSISHEWYRETDQGAKKIDRRYSGSLEHHKKGGLFLREIKS